MTSILFNFACTVLLNRPSKGSKLNPRFSVLIHVVWTKWANVDQVENIYSSTYVTVLSNMYTLTLLVYDNISVSWTDCYLRAWIHRWTDVSKISPHHMHHNNERSFSNLPLQPQINQTVFINVVHKNKQTNKKLLRCKMPLYNLSKRLE